MGISGDYNINYGLRMVQHVSGTAVYDVNDLYSWIMNDFDEIVQMDDTVPQSAQTPTEYTFINGWFMDDDSFKYLKNGALKTTGWDGAAYDDGIRILNFQSGGYTSAVDSDQGKVVVGDPSTDGGTLLVWNNTTRRWWVRQDTTDDGFPTGETISISGGTGAGTLDENSPTGEALWANLYTLGTVVSGTQVYIIQAGSKIPSWWSTGHIDILVKVKESGELIDSADLRVFARKYQALYDHFGINVAAGGRNAVPLATADDINNTTIEGTVSGYSDITITSGVYDKDLNNGAGLRPYNFSIDCATRPLTEVYEYFKYVTRRTSSYQLNYTDGEQYTEASGGYTAVKASPLGTFAGGKYFGARGIWIENYDAGDAQNFQLIDGTSQTQVPPNTVGITVTSVISGDSVSVFRLTEAAGIIDKDEYTLDAGNNQGNGTVVVKEAITSDTPKDAVIRLSGDARFTYSTWSGSTFTLDSTLDQNYQEDQSAYVPIIDAVALATQISNTLIFSSGIPVLIRVRKKGILPFEVESAVGSTGLSVAAIRVVDAIVT